MTDNIIRVLSIEDNPIEAQLIQERLAVVQDFSWKLPCFEIESVCRLGAALERLNSRKYDAVLSDLDLPDSRAGETITRLRECIPHMPIVVLTGREDEVLAHESVCAGVQDYLYKNEATGELLARSMMYAIERQKIKIALQEEYTARLKPLNESLLRANQALESEIAERRRTEEVLLRDIRYRVRSSLQILSSLFRLQFQRTADERVRLALEGSRNRIWSMALICEKMYQSPGLDKIDCAEYVRSLIAYLIDSYYGCAGDIILKFKVDSVMLDLDTAVPCGLIVSELVTNALKHAFPPGKSGEISVELCSRNGSLVLSVEDNGVGFPENLNVEETDSLGLQLVVMLTKQLDGALKLDRAGEASGTRFEIAFPVD